MAPNGSLVSTSLSKLPWVLTGILAAALLWTNGFPFSVIANSSNSPYPIRGEESIMSKKSHGTSNSPVQSQLRWKADVQLADRIVNFNRRYAEHAGYWNQESELLAAIDEKINTQSTEPLQFYDSVTGNLLFTAPMGRSYQEFKEESLSHGWPSFRDSEVNWETVRALHDGEMVSVTGSHLGHNLPDSKGNRYCINLVSVAGYPESKQSSTAVPTMMKEEL